MTNCKTVNLQALEKATWTAEILGRPIRGVPQQLALIDLGVGFIGRRLKICEQLEHCRNSAEDLDGLLRLAFEAGRRCYW